MKLDSLTKCRIMLTVMGGSTIAIGVLLGLLGLMLSGCNSTSTSWGSAGSADAFKITTSIDANSGTPTPSVIAGGGSHVILFNKPIANGEQTPTTIGYSRRKSLWGLFSGETTSGNVSFLYIAGSAETPEQTASILKAIALIVNKGAEALTTSDTEKDD